MPMKSSPQRRSGTGTGSPRIRKLYWDSRYADNLGFLSNRRVLRRFFFVDKAFSKTEPLLKDCGLRFSFFFDLIEKECGTHPCPPLHRICSLMRKMGVQSFVE